MRLSISIPVERARSNRLGWLQYSGTKSGSVRPSGVVNRLAQSMALWWRGKAVYAISQGTRNAPDETTQTYCSGIMHDLPRGV